MLTISNQRSYNIDIKIKNRDNHMFSKENKTVSRHLRLTKKEDELLIQRAAEEGVSISTLMRKALDLYFSN